MKKSLFVLSLISACGVSVCAGAFPEHPTFQQVRNAFLSPEKAKSIKSARIIFSVTGDKGIKGFFMLRARQYDQVRIDILKGKEHLCAVRNKDKFWLFNTKEGAIDMQPAEAAGFEQYIAFLSVPFYEKQIFSAPVFVKEETVNNETRSVFEVKALNASGEVCCMSIDNKTQLLRKTKKTSKDDKTGYIVLYRNYKTIHDVKMPGTISISRVNMNLKMKLISADWNLTLDDSVFQKGKDVKDQEVSILLQRQIAVEEEKKEKQLNAENKAAIAGLERRIRILKMEIEEDESRLKNMEEAMKEDRSSVETVAGAGSSKSHSYWNGSCWSNRHSSDHTRSRAARKIGKEYEKIKKDYLLLRDQLLKKRTELSDLEFRMKQLQK